MAYQFPNEAGLEHAKSDLEEPIYAKNSIGANRILYTLRKTAHLAESPRWDLYLISVYTLARNSFVSGMRPADFEAAIDQDADSFMTFIGAYSNFRRPVPAIVYFYAPDYSAIPSSLLRVHTGHRLELDLYYKNLVSKIPVALTETTEDPSTRKFISVVGKSRLPHFDLVEKIRQIYNGQRVFGRIGTTMISHCPMDLHLYKSIPQLQLLESYTAAIFPPSEFGRKLVKDVKVPFNQTTHRIFGDDIHLAPLVRGKERSKIIELAEQDRWAIRTEYEIRNSFTSHVSSVERSQLTDLRL